MPIRTPSASTGDVAFHRFYYASGERIELRPIHDLIAVDPHAARGLPVFAKSLDRAQPLTTGLVLIDVRGLDPSVVNEALDSGIAQPVFEAQGARLVVVPEVRVEESRGKSALATLRNWIKQHAAEIEVSEADQRFTIHLKSKRGETALSLANQLVEQVAPEMAQARFIRLMKHPAVVEPPR